MAVATIDIKLDILKGISKIAKDEGTDEKTLINNLLSEIVEEYNDCELLKNIKQAESEFEEGKTIRLDVDGFNKRYGL